jgi:DNA primase
MADRAGLNLKVIQVEGAKDPADTILNNPEKWFTAVKEATPIYDYYLQSADKRYKVKNASDKKAVFAELLPIWSKIADPITKEHYIEKLAALLMVKDDLVRQELEGVVKQAGHSVGVTPMPVRMEIKKVNEPKIHDRRRLLEEYLISLLLHLPAEHTYVPNFPEALFTQEELKQIYVMLVLFLDSISFKGHAFKIAEYTKTLPPELVDTVDRLYLVEIDEKLASGNAWQKELEVVVAELKNMLIKASLEKLSLQIKNAQEFDKAESLETLNKRFRGHYNKGRKLYKVLSLTERSRKRLFRVSKDSALSNSWAFFICNDSFSSEAFISIFLSSATTTSSSFCQAFPEANFSSISTR